MNFVKMHGSGNDFVVFDARQMDVDWSVQSPKICDRHFGVGADGVILILNSDSADLRMRMYNPDGSEAEMCGNGIRCFTKFALERHIVPWPKNELTVETLAGIRTVEPLTSGTVERVRVGMGKPILEPNKIPVDPRHRLALVGRREQVAQWPTTSSTAYFEPEGEIVLDWPVAIPGNNFYITGVSMGNPHAVAFLDSSIDEINLHEIGPQIEHHPLFPNRVNFEVVNIIDRKHLRARVWERGAGATLACGTAACAIAVAARLHGYVDEVVDIDLPGGQLRVSWDGNQEIYMEGPATAVFESQWGA